VIRFSSVTRSYGSKVAVNKLDLHIPQGEVFAFLGPNGAGKTTSIKMMVGLLQPTSGTVEIAEYNVVKQPRLAKSRIGYVPDQPELYDKLSGREFLRFVADLHGMPALEAEAAIEEQSKVFEIADFYDNLTEDYSHGMKQRVAFAAAMIHSPDVVILDEPMVGLDPKSMRLVKDLLRRRAQAGTTVFMSTHTLAIAEEIADRIGVINQGELLFLGTFEELQGKLKNEEGNLEELYLTLTED
jgi:ABC-2 type transport system ATP-binding protein